MRRSVLARCAAVSVLAALGSLVPPASGQEAKPTGSAAAPTKAEPSPEELYRAKRPEVMAQIAARFESAAVFAWSNDLKQTAVELFKKVLEFDPENRKAKESLGWERKDGAWVPNEKKQKAAAEGVDSSRGNKRRGEYEKRLREAEVAAAKLLTDLGELAEKAGDEDAAKALWKQALAHDDQNALANERSGNKKVDGKWFTGRALAHKEFQKVYDASLKKAQDLAVAPVSCGDTTGISEKAGLKFHIYRTKNFRIESALSDAEIRDTLTWLERARAFYLDLFQVPDRLLEYSANPMVFVIGTTDEQRDKLIDACDGIAEKEKSFKKKFGAVAVGNGKLQLARFQNGEQANRECLHIATHSFVHDSFGQHAPWLSEALANAVSAAVKGANLKVCFSGEGSTGGIHMENISLEQAPKELRDWVQTGKDTPTGDFVKLPSDGLNALQIAKAWSIVMYLLEKDRSQAREYFAAAGQGNGGEASKDDRVLAQFFGDFPKWKDLDAVWREWAADVYKP
jgi:tetratricopeptide (TPR) repeat protein